MAKRPLRRVPPPRDTLAFFAALTRYWLAIIPLARRELRHWGRCASAIPDPILRRHALSKLGDEHLNSEAAAVLSLLAPIPRIASVVRLTVAFQVMLDYLDIVSEQRVVDPLRNGSQLHRALTAAVDLHVDTIDYYQHHPQNDDGGYLDALVATCRSVFRALPSTAAVAPFALRAAARCAEAQTRAHAAADAGAAQLAVWSAAQAPEAPLKWWELAAGAASSVSVHALLAAAADRRTTPDVAASIDAAYYPSICALNTLLDSLIDYSQDTLGTNHSYVAYYPTPAVAAARIGEIAKLASTGARGLRRGRRHEVIVAGIASFYLSAPGAATDFARPTTSIVTERLGPMFPLIFAIVRLRRRAPDKPV